MWQSIEAAPKETPVIIQTKHGRVFLARLEFGAAVDDSESPIWAWQAEHEHVRPDCWSADICWALNVDDEPSDPPVGWIPLLR